MSGNSDLPAYRKMADRIHPDVELEFLQLEITDVKETGKELGMVRMERLERQTGAVLAAPRRGNTGGAS